MQRQQFYHVDGSLICRGCCKSPDALVWAVRGCACLHSWRAELQSRLSWRNLLPLTPSRMPQSPSTRLLLRLLARPCVAASGVASSILLSRPPDATRSSKLPCPYCPTAPPPQTHHRTQPRIPLRRYSAVFPFRSSVLFWTRARRRMWFPLDLGSPSRRPRSLRYKRRKRRAVVLTTGTLLSSITTIDIQPHPTPRLIDMGKKRTQVAKRLTNLPARTLPVPWQSRAARSTHSQRGR